MAGFKSRAPKFHMYGMQKKTKEDKVGEDLGDQEDEDQEEEEQEEEDVASEGSELCNY